MKLIIDIPEDMYYAIEHRYWHAVNEAVLLLCVINGIPLPKGHGRLIDADKLKSMYSINRANFNTVIGIQQWIDDVPTIIGADKENKNE